MISASRRQRCPSQEGPLCSQPALRALLCQRFWNSSSMKGGIGNQVPLLIRKCIRTASELALAQLNEISPLFSSGPPNPWHSNDSSWVEKASKCRELTKWRLWFLLPRFTERIGLAQPLEESKVLEAPVLSQWHECVKSLWFGARIVCHGTHWLVYAREIILEDGRVTKSHRLKPLLSGFAQGSPVGCYVEGLVPWDFSPVLAKWICLHWPDIRGL